MTRTPQHELVQTAAARPSETDSRDVLLAALQVAAEIAPEETSTAPSSRRQDLIGLTSALVDSIESFVDSDRSIS